MRSYYFTGIAFIGSNKLATTGAFLQQVIKNADTLNAGVGIDPFIAVVDTAGNPITFKSIRGDGYRDVANAIAADKKATSTLAEWKRTVSQPVAFQPIIPLVVTPIFLS